MYLSFNDVFVAVLGTNMIKPRGSRLYGYVLEIPSLFNVHVLDIHLTRLFFVKGAVV